VVVVQTLALAVTILNLVLNNYLDAKIKKAEEICESIDKGAATKSKTLDTIAKTEKLREILADQPKPADKIEILISKLPNEISVKKISSEGKSAEVSVEAPSAISFASMVTNYFKDKSVKSIVLKSANLKLDPKVFEVTMEVNFK